MLLPLSTKARNLILQFESLDQPGAWPGGESGVTIGYGYDLGYTTVAEFLHDWGAVLRSGYIARLTAACGVKGAKAAQLAHTFADIRVLPEAARYVFEKRSVPDMQEKTERAFPGVEQLPADAQGALCSLVYNRGPKLTGAHREEMLAIHNILADGVQSGDLKLIAQQIRAMKAIWQDKNMGGLVSRREAEAALVESCVLPT